MPVGLSKGGVKPFSVPWTMSWLLWNGLTTPNTTCSAIVFKRTQVVRTLGAVAAVSAIAMRAVIVPATSADSKQQ